MKSTTIAVDVAKEVLEVAVSVRPGQVNEQRRLSRTGFVKFCAAQPPATMVLEACGSAHYWGRRLHSLGHRVVLLPPHATRPYVFRNKTDRTDTRELLEAFRNEAIHPVPVKSVSQQALTALHRLRSTWLATRTARINTVRGLLREFGCTLPLGAHHVLARASVLLADPDSDLPEALRPALTAACSEIRDLEDRIRVVEDQLQALADQTPTVCVLGPCISRVSVDTTRPPSLSPTSSPASSGPSGSTTSTFGRWLPERGGKNLEFSPATAVSCTR